MFGEPRLLTDRADSVEVEHEGIAMASTTLSDTPALERRPRGTGMTVAGVPVAPSVQTVLGTLRAHEPMTSADIQATTGLPRRTVYAALRTLRGLGVLMERPSLRDMRQSYVWLAAGAVRTEAAGPGASVAHGMQAAPADVPANWVQVR